MQKPHAVSHSIIALVAGTSLALVLGLSGCQPEPGQQPEPKPDPIKPDARAPSGRSAPGRLAQKEGIPESGVELGWGWNARTGSVISNRCVEFAPVQATGQRANLSMREVSDKSDVMSSLDVSASVSVSAIFGASGSAQASFASQSRVSATSTSLMLRATIENGVLFTGPKQDPVKARSAFPAIGNDGQPVPPSLDWKKWQDNPPQQAHDEVTLTSWAKDLLRQGGMTEFVRHCGDSYVSAIYSGAELLAITTFTAKDTAEKKSITAALKAEYGVVQASAAMKQNREATLGSTSMDVSYMQVGGGSGILPTTRDKLVEKLESIAIEAAQNPKFHAMEVTPYDQLASWPGDSIPAEDPKADGTISNHYWALTSLNDDIQSILDDYGAYWTMTGLGSAELRHLQDDVNRLRSDIYQGARLGRTGTAASTFRFQSTPLAALNAPASPGAGPAWAKAAFAARLEASAPQQNVNALRLNLPLPLSAAAGLNESNAAQAVVAFYVGQQSKRICARNPSDSECLSNEQLRALEDEVRLNFPTVPVKTGAFRLRNLRDGLCLASPDGKATSPLVTANCADNPAQIFHLARNADPCNIRLETGALDAKGQPSTQLFMTAAYANGVVHRPCVPRARDQRWLIDGAGQVRIDIGHGQLFCIQSAGEGRSAVLATCAAKSDLQKWKVVYR